MKRSLMKSEMSRTQNILQKKKFKQKILTIEVLLLELSDRYLQVHRNVPEASAVNILVERFFCSVKNKVFYFIIFFANTFDESRREINKLVLNANNFVFAS